MNDRVAKAQSTEWTAVFLTAAELTRRGYTVGLTMGNRTPLADLMVGHLGSGKQFWVNVKGMAGRAGGWFARERPPLLGLFYILVSIDQKFRSDAFYIVPEDAANALLREYRLRHAGAPPSADGFSLKSVISYLDRWDLLPR